MHARPAQIAFVGLGRMGLPMCARLVAAGFEVCATDLRAQARTDADAAGARWAPSIADTSVGADVLVTMLPGPGEVADAAAEIVGGLPAGAFWIDMSTAAPAVARTVASAAGPRGLRVLDVPVGGGPEQAREGRLLAFAGGEAENLRRCRPVLDVLADRVLHVGPAGSGYAVKLLVNLLWFGQALATAEVLTVARRLGLELGAVRGALLESAAATRFLADDAPALLAGDDMTSFSLARCCEELSSVLALGAELKLPLELATVVSDLHERALERYGDVDGELLGARWVAERAGVELRSGPQPPAASPPSEPPQRRDSV